MTVQGIIDRENRFMARNYHPLPVVLARGEGVWVWDTDGNKYLDFLSAYSAVSAGHSNPRILNAMMKQAQTLDVPSRAFHTEILGQFVEQLCVVTGMDKALPMNTGAEAVETAIKAARRWGYRVKGIAKDKAQIIVAEHNFHGRTTTIVGFSSEPLYRDGFGPFPDGFDIIPYGDADALEAAITPDTCAFLVEPIQGEAGIIVPPGGFLKRAQEICKKNDVLFILDEIQTGMARTGKDFCYQHEIDKPDGLTLGKALGGGVYPVSAFLARKDVMDVFEPGSHGSTFGGNPIAASIGLEALAIMKDEKLSERSHELGEILKSKLNALQSPLIKEVRGKGLLIGMEIDPAHARARTVCEKLKERGLLCKETHETTVRFAPPLIITRDEIDWAVEQVAETLTELSRQP
ncbi:MAG TPA: ornithine--oxo-acid transaminase [Alphaproteobacteria bacterium]|nr:ornithine--oxo-acid transaminase [Alphaproteobacteria bacterium]HNS43970.1 ornithine--oxo-acid transaminase [Alphaproteobacteria bacterium]